MGFIFGLPPDVEGCSGVLVLVDRLTKMVQLIPVNDTVTAVDSAVHFIDCIFRHHGLSESIRPRPAVHLSIRLALRLKLRPNLSDLDRRRPVHDSQQSPSQLRPPKRTCCHCELPSLQNLLEDVPSIVKKFAAKRKRDPLVKDLAEAHGVDIQG
ncbi:hypothetical protein PR001_g14391 [Phytophthora rubi]|uniref:Integrase zinc-binding domain-containing protein n=1 Tax=Phytophthora rubi TaxID=129364 RepID=A0A6A3LNT6_9STRA|nr:hypothetical protein PR001_g14391 [Phytophthora rubi]